MIQSLEISNFISHRNTVLDFHPGFNVIIGSSAKGKSVILRMLEWIIHNRIHGKLFNLSYVSHWAVNEKDKITLPVIGKLIINDNTIIRKRTENFNGYIVNNKELGAVKSDVPFEVKNILNFTDVNLQKQFDSPFLLSQSAGKVAEYFNEIIKIDDIDKVLSLTDKKKRKSKSDLKYVKEDLKDVEEKLIELEYLDKVKILLGRAERAQNKLDSLNKIKNRLQELIDKKIRIENRINKVDIEGLKIKFDKVYKLNVSINRKGELFLVLKRLVDKKIKLENKIKEYEKVKNVKVYLDEIEKIRIEIDKKEKRIKLLKNIIRNKEYYEKEIEDNNKQLEKLKGQLPEVCPACNSLKKDWKIDFK